MLANIGFYLLFLCCLVSCYGSVASVGAAFFRHRRLYRSARMALTLTCVMMVTAALILWFLLFQRDYSVAYIFRNSSNDLPAFYTLSAFWSALEGSHTFWMLLMTLVSTVALWTYSADNEHIMPYVSAALQAVLGWMFYLAITYSDPFVLQLPVAPNGQGMNALLQNPYMAIHPPILFLGYVCLAVPFAYAIAALCYGDITAGWLRTVRRWTLFGWCALTAAIALGGRWAYVELGWAGYWAWDPVENSSFLPWLMATALLHSLLVQGQIGHLKRLSIVLAVLGFFMSFFGTFITRSGVISSVHSFAESPIGPNYLSFLAVVMLVSCVLYGWRANTILPADTDKVWGFSKESALIVTQFLLLSFAAIVFIGTVFPIVSEAVTKQRISVQAPYFNAFAPFIGLGFILAIAVGNLMRYNSEGIPDGKRVMQRSALVALPVCIVFCYFGDVWQTPSALRLGAQVVGSYLVFWSLACLTFDFYNRLRDLRFNWRLLFQRNLAYTGAYVAHVGALIAILGFMGNVRGINKEVSLKAGESVELYGYQFSFADSGIAIVRQHNATLYQAPLMVTRGDKEIAKMSPARSKYPTKPELLHEIAVNGGFWHDLYIVLTDFEKTTGKQATLQLHINPTVRLVWISIYLMVIGGLIALADRSRGLKTRDALLSD